MSCVEPVLTMRNRKTLRTNQGCPLEIVTFFRSKRVVHMLFDICFMEGNVKIDSVRRSLPGDFWIIQIEEWITNQKDRMCWSLNFLFCSLSG